MAIPLSNEMKEVRAPRTAEIMPMDNQKLIEGMGQMALGMNRQMQEGFRGGLKLGQQIMDNQDAFKRNEAERKYNERTTELNTELAQKEGEERVKFQPKYEAEMKLASDTYEAAINKVHNFDIREGSKRSINAWNNRNASNYQYGNYKNETDLQEKAMGQAMLSSHRKRLDAINEFQNAASLTAMATDPNLGFAHEEQMIRDFYGKRKGLPADVVEQYVQDFRTKGYISMANRLAQVTDKVNQNAAYDQSLAFLDQGVKAGLINNDEAINAKRELEGQKLDMIAETMPGWLVNDDGTYNFTQAHRYAPDLNRKEIYRHIKFSSSNGSGSGGFSDLQDELDDAALEMWNTTVSTDGLGDQLATDDYKEDNQHLWAGQDNKGKTRGQKVAELVKIVTLGDTLLNGRVVLEADGSYSELKPNETAAAIKARGGHIVSRRANKELKRKVNQAWTMLTTAVQDGSYADVFSPDLFARTRNASYQEKALIAQLANVKRAYPENEGWLPLKIKTGLNRLGLGKFDTQTKGNITPAVVKEAVKGVQIGLGEAARKYGIDVDSLEDIGNNTVRLKQWNDDKKQYEIIPDMEPVTLNDAVGLEIGKATMLRMDDGMFHTIYGETTQRPNSISDLHYGGYQMDWRPDNYSISNKIQKTTAFADELLHFVSSVGMDRRVFGDDSFIPRSKGLRLNVSDDKISNAFKKASASLKYSYSIGQGGAPEDYLNFQRQQFLESVYSGKEGNEPWTYGEFISKMGAGTPEAYRSYLGNKGALNRASRAIIDTNALDKNKPGHFFLSNSKQTDELLADMYRKAVGLEPSNEEYIDKDITLKDVIDTNPLGFKAPAKAFDKPDLNANYSAESVNDGAPVFFVTRNGNGYIINNDKIKNLDVTAGEFVNLLGILNEYQDKGAVTEQTASYYDPSQVSEEFK